MSLFYGVSISQMRLGLTTFAIISLVSFCIMTRHRTSAGYEETLENGKEYREEQAENTEVSNGGALGWRRRRNVIGKLNEWQTIGLPDRKSVV